MRSEDKDREQLGQGAIGQLDHSKDSGFFSERNRRPLEGLEPKRCLI